MTKCRSIMCPTCDGLGYKNSPRTRDTHGEAYLCPTCEGDRVVEEVTTVTYRRSFTAVVVDNLRKKNTTIMG